MKIVPIEQNSPEWHIWRRRHITATCASVIMGMNNFQDPFDLWQEMLELIPPKPETEAMRRGRLLEPIARELLSDQIGIHFHPIVIESDKFLWAGASLDGISYDKTVQCEIKCPGIKKHQLVSIETLDPSHFCQVQHQLFCTGNFIAIYCSYHPDAEEKLKIIEIPREDEFIEKMVAMEAAFYDNLANFSPPENWIFKEKERK